MNWRVSCSGLAIRGRTVDVSVFEKSEGELCCVVAQSFFFTWLAIILANIWVWWVHASRLAGPRSSRKNWSLIGQSEPQFILARQRCFQLSDSNWLFRNPFIKTSETKRHKAFLSPLWKFFFRIFRIFFWKCGSPWKRECRPANFIAGLSEKWFSKRFTLTEQVFF